jgi:hypothetical protein
LTDTAEGYSMEINIEETKIMAFRGTESIRSNIRIVKV